MPFALDETNIKHNNIIWYMNIINNINITWYLTNINLYNKLNKCGHFYIHSDWIVFLYGWKMKENKTCNTDV